MWIHKIKLVNFQKHELLEVKFTDKVNVVLGETGVGKSCLVRAIRWVIYNSPKGDIVRKSGTERTEVSILFDNGVMIKRIKSDRENAYCVKRGNDEKRYDSIGKNIPKDVLDLLGVTFMIVDKEQLILNMSSQISLPFLISDSSTFRMKLFNKLTGNDILDIVAKSFNSSLLEINKKSKVCDELIITKVDDLKESVKEFDSLTDLLDILKSNQSSLVSKYDKYIKILKIKELLSENRSLLEYVSFKIQKVNFPSIDTLNSLKKRTKRYIDLCLLKKKISENLLDRIFIRQSLENIKVPNINFINLFQRINLYNKIKIIQDKIIELGVRLIDNKYLLKNIKVPDTFILKNKCKKYNEIFNINLKFNSIELKVSHVIGELKDIEVILIKCREDYREIFKFEKKCPICFRAITDSILNKVVSRI